MRPRKQFVPIGRQIAAMQSYFPQFQFRRAKRGHHRPTWIGTLQPTEKSPEYVVKVTYSYSPDEYPKVWVVSPPIDPSSRHLYRDGSLCLHYPKDWDWRPQEYLAKTIIPWTAEWLAFYEIWRLTGEWYGEEAPHTGAK
jgi:hypothetical protein